MTRNLEGMKVLIAEDEYLLANELAAEMRACGAEILGPYATLGETAKAATRADLAILDIDLNGELVFPVAQRLSDLGRPFVFFTGYDSYPLPPGIAEAWQIGKHLAPAQIRRYVEEYLRFEALVRSASDSDDLGEVLAELRAMARLLIRDPEAADTLVERTLEVAVNNPGMRPPNCSVSRWLVHELKRVYRRQGGHALQ